MSFPFHQDPWSAYYPPVYLPPPVPYVTEPGPLNGPEAFWHHDQPSPQQDPVYAYPHEGFAPRPLYGAVVPQAYDYRMPAYGSPAFPATSPGWNRRQHNYAALPQSTSRPVNQLAHNRILGPPRKSRQTPHTLWVGNLPLHTSMTALKDHFASGFAATIDSVFLISRTRCAFVNFKSQIAATDALLRFNGSYFGGMQLICRARGPGSDDVPHATKAEPTGGDNNLILGDLKEILRGQAGQDETGGGSPVLASTVTDEHKDTSASGASSSFKASTTSTSPPSLLPPSAPRFFIMKSLAVENLEQAVHNCHWATQKHNATKLNEAFQV